MGGRFPGPVIKNAVKPVKIIFVDIILVSDNVAAVLSYDKGITQRTVRIKEEDLAHILGGKAHDHGETGVPAGHGIFAGDAEQNHAVPLAVNGGRHLALPAPQALQKQLRVVELHRVAENHLDLAIGRIEGGAQKMPRPRAVFNLLSRAVIGIPVSRRDMRDGFRHGQAQFNDRLKV